MPSFNFRSSMNKDYKKTWRQKCRMYLAAAFGAKCTICGYDKTITALDYHHVDPASKDKILSVAMRNGSSWNKIVEEAKKCACVCCRCHREIHAGITELPENYTRFNEEYCEIYVLKTKEFDQCPICGQEKLKSYKFCSQQCSHQNQMRFSISKEELYDLVIVQQKSFVELGKMLGVTDNAVKKRCKSFGIPTKYWDRKLH